jgi:hypothetical protein
MKFLAYDLKLKKVGCVLLQATMGGDSQLAARIPNEDWLLGPTPDLQVYRLTDEQAEQLVKMHKGL